MKILLDFSKTTQQNALHYFDQAKKLKQKIAGAQEGMQKVQSKLRDLEKKQSALPQKKSPQLVRKKEWFEKFHWCYTRNGLLVVGGRDAHSNESLVKKYLEEKDWHFHADIHGAPHCILKEGKLRAKKKTWRTPLPLPRYLPRAGKKVYSLCAYIWWRTTKSLRKLPPERA